MSLPILTLDAELASAWRSVLEDNNLVVSPNQTEDMQHPGQLGSLPRRVSEVPWRIVCEEAELRLLALTYRDQDDGRIYLVFMPTRTRAERKLLSYVHKLLIAAGASPGKK